ncbi:MAG: DUF2520 domain-containing protein [Acidobacteriota bacterium]
MQSVSIIGVGRIGGALAIALTRADFEIEFLIHRDPTIVHLVTAFLPATVKLVPASDHLPAFQSDIVLVTTPDPDIAHVGALLRGRLKDGSVVLHTSGSLSSEIFADLAAAGHHVGSVHPLVSVSDAVSGADNFSNVFFCLEGDEAAVTAARAIVEALGGRPFSIDSAHKPLYHAAAVTACGHLVALIDIAAEMLAKCGVEKEGAKQILLPLITSTINNLQTQTPARALTGSFARMDSSAVERHLSAIDREMSERVREVYLLLGEQSLDLAASIGGNAADEEKLREVISIAKRKSG